MLTIDDLARISASKLQEHQVTKEIGNTLAKDFRKAGVAFADPTGPSSSGSPCHRDCDTAYDTCVQNANAEYDGITCGWGNIFCPTLHVKLKQCEHDQKHCHNACDDVPDDPEAPPFDKLGCQDRCDSEAMGHFTGPIGDGIGGVEGVFEQCSQDNISNPGNVPNCVAAALTDHIPTANLVNLNEYLLCCYGACDLEKEGTDDQNCKWGDHETNNQ